MEVKDGKSVLKTARDPSNEYSQYSDTRYVLKN